MFLLLTADHAERRWLCESHQEEKSALPTMRLLGLHAAFLP